jgi:hypothetical protein
MRIPADRLFLTRNGQHGSGAWPIPITKAILPKYSIRANLALNRPVKRWMSFNSNEEVPCLTL